MQKVPFELTSLLARLQSRLTIFTLRGKSCNVCACYINNYFPIRIVGPMFLCMCANFLKEIEKQSLRTY